MTFKGHRYWLAVVFFLLASAPGFWFPVLTNVLKAYDLGGWKVAMFLVPPIASMVSPLIFGAQVDRRFEAQKVLGWIMISGAAFLYLAFHAMENNWGGGWVFALFLINGFISAPAWSLLTTITLSSLPDPGRSFGYFRVWGTIGWMISGLLVSWGEIDTSAVTGKIAAGVRIIAAAACFLLPVTMPKGGVAKGWMDSLGFSAIRLLKDRDLLVYYGTALLFSIPLSAYYLHSPQHLQELGVEQVGAAMTPAQAMETFAMLAMGWVVARYRVKTILLVAIGAGVLRYAFYAVDSVQWLILGITLHGICWTFFFEAGKVFVHRRVEEGMRTQAQALLVFFTGGVAGLVGVPIVEWIRVMISPHYGWTGYWLLLTGINVTAMSIFAIGYRGLQPARDPNGYEG